MGDRSEYHRKWYRENKRKANKTSKEWAQRNPERIRELNRLSQLRQKERIRKEVLYLLGDKCSNPECPIPQEKVDKKALQVDHKNGGGSQFRKKEKGNYMRIILKELKNGSKEYQLLCAYCNYLKRFSSRKERGGRPRIG